MRCSVLGLAVLGGTEKRNTPPAITRSTVNTAIPFRTTISGTVFAGASRDEVVDKPGLVEEAVDEVVDDEIGAPRTVEEVETGG